MTVDGRVTDYDRIADRLRRTDAPTLRLKPDTT